MLRAFAIEALIVTLEKARELALAAGLNEAVADIGNALAVAKENRE